MDVLPVCVLHAFLVRGSQKRVWDPRDCEPPYEHSVKETSALKHWATHLSSPQTDKFLNVNIQYTLICIRSLMCVDWTAFVSLESWNFDHEEPAPSQSQWDVGCKTHSEQSCSDWEGSRSPATFEEPKSWKGTVQRCVEILPDSARWACACPCLVFTPLISVMAGQGERGCTFHISALWWGQMGTSLKVITTGNLSYFFVKT